MNEPKCRHCGRGLYLLEIIPGLLSEWRHVGCNYMFCYPGSATSTTIAVPEEA